MKLLLALLLVAETPHPGSTRRLFVPEDSVAIERQLRDDDRLSVRDRLFMEQLQRKQPTTIHKLERFRLDDLLRGGEER